MELEAQQQKDQGSGHDQDRHQTRERLLLRPVAPRKLPAVAGWKFQLRKLFLQFAIDRAQVAFVQFAGDRDDRLLVFPPELVGAADDANRGELTKRNEAHADRPPPVLSRPVRASRSPG